MKSLCLLIFLAVPSSAAPRPPLGASVAGWTGGFADFPKRLDLLKKQGFTLVSLVPAFPYIGHDRIDPAGGPAWDRVEAAYRQVDAARKPTHPTLRLAAENMWDDVFLERLERNVFPSYANTKAFLVEIPPAVMPPNLRDRLFALRMQGRIPVLAHPERYHALWDDDELATALRRCCVFAIDLPAVAGFHGKREAKQARHLLECGLAGVVATDAHQPGDVQQAQQGVAWIAKKLGSSVVDRLFGDAPRAVLAGEFVE